MKKPILSLSVIIVIAFSLFTVGKNWFESKKEQKAEQFFEEEKEESGDRLSGAGKQMNMWWWGRAYPEPANLNGKYLQAWEHAVKMKDSKLVPHEGFGEARTAAGAWSSIGPRTLGGRMLSLAINPLRHRTLFAGSASGGIWKSYTGGVGLNAWQPVTTNLPVLGVSSIAYHPTDTNIIYAGTGEVYRYDSASGTPNPGNTGYNVWKTRGTYGVGLLRSTNAGGSWTQVYMKSMSDLFGIQKIRIHPSNADWVMIAATDGLYRYDNSTGVTTKLFSVTYVSDVYVNPSNVNEVVIAVGNLGNTFKGVLRSTDGGTNFTKITAGLPASFNGFINFDRHAGSNTLYASIGVSSGAGTELYRSTDFGSTWQGISSTGHAQWQYWFAHTAAVDPNNVNQVFILGASVKQRGVIAGTSFGSVQSFGNSNPTMDTYIALGGQEGPNTYLHDDIHDAEFVPGRSDSLYIMSDGGIFLTTNANTAGTITLQSCNSGLVTSQFFGPVGQSGTDANFFLGGLQDNNTAVYNGSLWKREVGGDGGPSQVKPDDDNIVLSSRDARAVYRSTNKAGSYAQVLSYWGSAADSRTGFMAPVAWSRNNTNVVYVASDNLHRSTDAGQTFNDNSWSTAANYIDAYRKPAVALATAPSDANVVIASTSPFAQYDNDIDNIYYNPDANLLKTTTGNTPFTSIYGGGLPTPNRYVMDIAFHPTNSSIIWVSLGGFGSGHVYRSTDGGTTWENRSGSGLTGLPDVPTNAIMLDPFNANTIYAGNDLGVYISLNAGATWYDFNGGLWDATQIMDLVAVPGNKIRAATHGKGVFESVMYSGTLPVELVDFSGVHKGDYNELKWKVSHESSMSHYELERSADGQNFTAVHSAASVSSTALVTYSHNDILGAMSSFNFYYRVKMVNLDGTFEYSDVILVRGSGKNDIVVLGNPFHDLLTIRYSSGQPGQIRFTLVDMNGRAVRTEKITVNAGSGFHELRGLGTLPAGTYLLNSSVNQQSFTQKLLKK
jgi:hypothetical protein